MIVDSRLLFSDSQAVTTVAADSTSSVDLGGDFDFGPGTPLYWVVQVDVAATDNYTVILETDGDSAFGSATTIATINILENDAAGTTYVVGLPFANEEYLQVNIAPDAADGAVTFSSWLTSEQPFKHAAYPDNVPA